MQSCVYMEKLMLKEFCMKKILIFVMALSGCSTSLSEYKENTPEFRLEKYFDGDLVAYGVVQNYAKKLTRHFCVTIRGEWETDANGVISGVLDEQFIFDDGERQTRIWTLEYRDGRYYGTAGDVIGEAKGNVAGNAFRWQYKLRVPIKNDEGEIKEYTFAIDDWIYLLDEERAFNRSVLKKWGFKVGEISIFFEKQSKSASCT